MKVDMQLGHEVHNHLVQCGVESPIDYDVYRSTSSAEKRLVIEKNMIECLQVLGFKLNDDSVRDTPSRVAKMWVDEVMSGLNYDKFPKIMTFENGFKAAGMVTERRITSMSLCSHHLVTIDGEATVAYIPDAKVIGLSKISRIVDFFSRRPQEAERLTLQIYHALQYILGTDNIAVHLSGVHYCMKARGPRDLNASTTTVKLGGEFMTDAQLRAEFYSVVNSNTK